MLLQTGSVRSAESMVEQFGAKTHSDGYVAKAN
jgi:hypothetical protein